MPSAPTRTKGRDPLMDDLLEELRGDQHSGGRGCQVCKWLEGRPEAEQEKWRQAFLDRDFSKASLLRAAQRRDFPYKLQSLETHIVHVRSEVAVQAIRPARGKAS